MKPDVDRTATSRFLDQISRYPLMTPDEEIICARAVQKMQELESEDRRLTRRERHAVVRGRRAKDRFVEANMRLVVFVSKEYLRRRLTSLSLMDIVQEGSFGLIRAIEKFDPERGYKFSTYAYWWIRQAILRAILQKDSLIRRPMGVAEISYNFKRVAHSEMLRLGRTPTRQELAKALKTNVDELDLYLVRGLSMASLDARQDDDKSPLMDSIADPNSADTEAIEDALDADVQMAAIEAAMTYLTQEEQDLIRVRYSPQNEEPLNYTEMARMKGCSRERMRQMVMKATKKLSYYANRHERGTLLPIATTPLAPVPRSEPSLCA